MAPPKTRFRNAAKVSRHLKHTTDEATGPLPFDIPRSNDIAPILKFIPSSPLLPKHSPPRAARHFQPIINTYD